MTIDTGLILALFGLVIADYVTNSGRIKASEELLTKRVEKTEDAVENKIGGLTIELSLFRIMVAERLAAIETHLKGGLNPGGEDAIRPR